MDYMDNIVLQRVRIHKILVGRSFAITYENKVLKISGADNKTDMIHRSDNHVILDF